MNPMDKALPLSGDTCPIQRTSGRLGLSLIESIVVIAILTLLIGLGIPAVQRVRDVSGRTACLNQFRQIGMALHQYHGTHGALPPGVAHPAQRPGAIPSSYGPETDTYPLLNWQARLLPYIEQESLWRATQKAYALDPYSIKAPPHVALFIPIALFLCPADSPRLHPNVPLEETPAVTSYIGSAGTNWYRQDGLLFLDSRVRFRQIVDGASYTLMAGERPPTLDLVFGRWYGGWGGWGTANAFLGVRETEVPRGLGYHHCADGPHDFQRGSLQDPCSAYHFWSLHRGGANFLVADGSVRFLSYSAAPLLPALATRAGREVAVWPD